MAVFGERRRPERLTARNVTSVFGRATEQNHSRTRVEHVASEPEFHADGATVAYFRSAHALRDYLTRVMRRTGFGLGVTTLSAAATLALVGPNMGALVMTSLVGGLGGGIASMIAMARTAPPPGVFNPVESTNRKLATYSFFASSGLLVAPGLLYAMAVSPLLAPIAGGLTLATTSGMVLFGLSRPKGSLLKYGPALSVGLFGLIGVSIVNLFFPMTAVHSLLSFGGVALFSAFTAYDTQQVIDDFQGNLIDDASSAAVNFHLNIINLFQHLVHILAPFFRSSD